MTSRKPTHLKILTGSDRPDRAPREPVAPRPGRAKPPTWLPAPERAAFRGLVAELEGLGLPSRSFVHLLTSAAVQWAVVQRCTEFLDGHGESYETTTTTGAPKVVPRPEVASRNAALRLLKGLLAELGLSPTAIGRVDRAALPVGPGSNSFAALAVPERRSRRVSR